MSNKTKIDRILEEATQQIQSDVSALLGASLVLSPFSASCKSKENCFVDLIGKQVFAYVDVTGDIEDKAGLFVKVNDAILLGATLVMIPEAEIEALIGREEYNEELDDSYGEIANIIIGSLSKVFEDNYSTPCRLVRKETEVISPAKIDCDGDELIPNQNYYFASTTLNFAGNDLGDLVVMLPAAAFEVDELDEVVAADNSSVTEGEGDSSLDGSDGESQADSSTEESIKIVTPEEREKTKKMLDALLKESFEKVGPELGMLLGVDVSVTDLENKVVSKEQFFQEGVTGKQVVSNFNMTGSIEGSGYFNVSLKDAIHMGGVLIMLPPSELEIVVQEEEFDEDAKDAFGEIANILSGVYTAVFEDQHFSKTRFVRGEMQSVKPLQVDVESDDPFPNRDYYSSSMKLVVNGAELGTMTLLLPADDFGIVPTEEEKKAEAKALERAAEAATNTGATAQQQNGDNGGAVGTGTPGSTPISGNGGGTTIPGQSGINGSGQVASSHIYAPVQDGETYDVLVVSNESVETGKIIQTLQEKGYVVGQLGFNDNASKHITNQLKAVYIVMAEVGEQGFGVAIKLSMGTSLPLIAVGPSWTRSTVMKAVKYGIKDILLSPTASDDIYDNIDRNIVALAA